MSNKHGYHRPAPSLRSYMHQDDSKADTETISERINPSKITSSSNNTIGKKTAPAQDTKYANSIRTTSNDYTDIKSAIKYENTYKLRPDDQDRLLVYKIEPKLKQLLHQNLEQCDAHKMGLYNSTVYASFTRDIADLIRNETKPLVMKRYKVVAHVLIGQAENQDIRVVSRCLWNIEFDNSINLTYYGKNIFVVVTVYFLYKE